MTKKEPTLEEILNQLVDATFGLHSLTPKQVAKAQSQIEAQYISKDKLKKLLKEKDEEGLGWDMYFTDKQCCPGDDVGYIRNQLRSEIKKKLGLE